MRDKTHKRVARGFWISCIYCIACAWSTGGSAATDVDEVCALLGNKLTSVSTRECLALGMVTSGVHTASGEAIVYKEYPPLKTRTPLARVLFLGGIHGDEYAAFSVAIKWMATLNKHHSGLFHWRIAPALNMGGLLKSPAVRTNSNRVDLNRNMASLYWDQTAHQHWEKHAHKNPRYYPGVRGNSEPETQWVADQIATFQPDVIIALHSPYGLVDYDGPADIHPPQYLGPLVLKDLATYPGSLGRYAADQMGIPVLTIELASSRQMPASDDIRKMWLDLVRWLRVEIGGHVRSMRAQEVLDSKPDPRR